VKTEAQKRRKKITNSSKDQVMLLFYVKPITNAKETKYGRIGR